MDFAKQFGKKVRTLRTELGMTQAELAKAAKVGANYIPRLERGEMVPSVENTCRIARALGVTVDELCGRAGGGKGRKESSAELALLVRKLSKADIETLRRVVRLLEQMRDVRGRGKRGRG